MLNNAPVNRGADLSHIKLSKLYGKINTYSFTATNCQNEEKFWLYPSL